MNSLETKQAIQFALTEFAAQPLANAATSLLEVLGYTSQKRMPLRPNTAANFSKLFVGNRPFNEAQARIADWKSVDFLFQLTDQELQASLFKDTSVSPELIKSYLFFAIELTGSNYARGKLTGITRQLNRLFPMPVMVLIKHLVDKCEVLSIAVVNRRQNTLDGDQDVLEKVTIIRDISLSDPHRGHLDILTSLVLPDLVHPQRLPINSFDTLHAAWEEIFNVELLNKRFYLDLSKWYFWALTQVEFPADIEKDDEKRRATSLIRLLTRLIFCWFLKEKNLIPEKLFVEAELAGILANLDSDSSTFYQAILQNLFFATLNQRMGKDKNGEPYRAFATDEGCRKNRATYGVDNFYRYESQFRDPATALDHFADVPFLNGGLFERLDSLDEATGKELYLDGFSRNPKKRAQVPNRLFFADEHLVDLSADDGETNRKNETVRGLLRILNAYNFTIVENTPIDHEIALDPELLGKVFENLLACYNEETKTTARKQTGSFYTPRPIVDYMVDESLKAHLMHTLTRAGMQEDHAKAGLEILFAYTERAHPFDEREADALLEAIHNCKILDPACGSGAFPMGMLQKLVYIIHKLDRDNAKWQQLQIEAAAKIPDPSARDSAIAAIERDFADNNEDYGRKLYLLENCLYGVDIQPIAIQIAKLRCFISLVSDQRANHTKEENHGIRPLPNLETKFVAANTLMGLPDPDQKMFGRSLAEGFDVVIGNPPYFKEKDNKHRFDGLRERECYQGKMDVWYLFVDVGLDILRENGVLSYIATNNWVTNAGASKLRNKILNQATLVLLIDFQNFLVFESASIQTMVMLLQKSRTPETYTATISKAKPSFSHADVCNLSSEVKDPDSNLKTFAVEIDRAKLLDRPLVFNSEDKASILHDIERGGRFYLSKAEIGQGIVPNPDRVNSRNIKTIGSQAAEMRGIKLGDGVFVLDSAESEVIEEPERQYLKPLYEPIHISKYHRNESDLVILYTKKGSFSPTQVPSIITHLSKFREIMETRRENQTGQIAFYNLHWPRNEDLFESGGKILAPRKCSEPIFYYTEDPAYVMLSMNVIKTPRLNMRCLSAILNSSVIRYWLRYKGSMQGLNFQIDSGPLQQIPIAGPSRSHQELVAILVDLMQCGFRSAESRYVTPARFLEDLIDACVMECYFHEHMSTRNLLFLDDLSRHFATYDLAANESKKREFLAHLHRILNTRDSEIRNRLLRLTVDSPLVAVIKAEGRVIH